MLLHIGLEVGVKSEDGHDCKVEGYDSDDIKLILCELASVPVL